MQNAPPELRAEINVTPLVDVVLVLLIIFMVVTPMIVSKNVVLPETSNPQAQPEEPQKIVYLTETGNLFFEDIPVPSELLLQRLQDLHQRRPATRILLQADRRLTYQKIIEAMDLISRSGFSEIGLIAKPIAASP